MSNTAEVTGQAPAGGTEMSCEHLICARCTGPVVEGRCPACQLSRAQMHRHPSGLSLPLVAAVLIMLALFTLALQLAH
jgi:hypothetical protein